MYVTDGINVGHLKCPRYRWGNYGIFQVTLGQGNGKGSRIVVSQCTGLILMCDIPSVLGIVG